MDEKTRSQSDTGTPDSDSARIRLNSRQAEIGRLVGLGYSNREVATELLISEQAVKSALHSIFDKLGVWNRVELVNRLAEEVTAHEMNAVIARHEARRREALEQLDVKKLAPKQELDDILQVAAMVCSAPLALLSIVEAERLWFLAEHGLGAKEVKRSGSFCDHAASGSKLMVVHDALADDRFSKHPYVVNPPRIRFYAGAPVIDPDGHALGVLCVLDQIPRELARQQQNALQSLARLAVSILTGSGQKLQDPSVTGRLA